MTENHAVTGDVYHAGFWRRVVAYFIDSIVLLIAWIFLGVVAAFVFGSPMFDPEIYRSGGAEEIETAIVQGNLAFAVSFLIYWLYFAGFEAWGPQATPGKLVLGLKVTDLLGERIGFGRASIRFWGKYISTMILGIGFLMVAFTARKQGLHDMMAGCLVVRRPLA